MAKATSPKKVEAIRGLWEAEMSPSEIAEIMGLNVSTIHRILVRIGAREPDKSSGNRLTTEQKVDILRLYQEGMTVEEIMATVGCSKPTVYKYVHQAGLSREITEEAIEKAIQLYMAGQLTVSEICEKTGMSKPTFYRKLKKYLNKQGS
jgi:DNA invertase Pin-like site-specific DNA recombinase